MTPTYTDKQFTRDMILAAVAGIVCYGSMVALLWVSGVL